MCLEKRILPDYFGILEENKIAKYNQSKSIKVCFDREEEIDALWKKHDEALDAIHLSDVPPKQSLLDLKIEIAKRLFSNCCFCERRCGVDRNIETGKCGVKKASITSEFLHTGEEDILVPSHTLFFSGCTFNCVFCQNWDISQRICGFHVQPEKIADIIIKRIGEGSRNVNWVGGDPTPNILYILQVLKNLNANIPQVWNSNMYCSVESMKLLHGIVDIYLSDFKFGNNYCAKRLANVDDYIEIVCRNHEIAYEHSEMIIRHLVMPNHIECCSKPSIDWISEHVPGVLINIMSQYKPEYHADEYEDISRSITMCEVADLKKYAKMKNLVLI